MTTYVYHQGRLASDVRTIFDAPLLNKVVDVTTESKFYFYRDNQGYAIAAIGTVGDKPSEESFELYRKIVLDQEILESFADQDKTIPYPAKFPESLQIRSNFILAFRHVVYSVEYEIPVGRRLPEYRVKKLKRSTGAGSGGRIAQAILDIEPDIEFDRLYQRIAAQDYLTSAFCVWFEQSDLKEIQS